MSNDAKSPADAGALTLPRDQLKFEPTPAWVTPCTYDARSKAAAGAAVTHLLFDRQVDAAGHQVHVHQAIRLETVQATRTNSQWRCPFEPREQSLALHSLKIRRAGAESEQANPAKVRLLQREEDIEAMVADGLSTVVITLDGLRPGDVLEWNYTITDEKPLLPEHCVDMFSPPPGVPIGKLFYGVRFNAQRGLKWKSSSSSLSPVESRSGPVKLLSWSVENYLPPAPEPNVPSWMLPPPWVQISDCTEWRTISEAIAAHCPLTEDEPVLEQIIRDLKSATEDPAVRVEAVMRFVQDEFRCVGPGIAPASRPPVAPAALLRRQVGDSKDLACLLTRLLRSLGLNARPVFVNSKLKKTLAELLPAPQFDKVVVEFTLDGQTRWMDPALKQQGGGPLGRVISDFGVGLPLDSQPASLVKAPAGSLTDGFEDLRESVLLDTSDKPSFLALQLTLKGVAADIFRDTVSTRGIEEVAGERLQFYHQRYSQATRRSGPDFRDDRDANEIGLAELYEIEGFLGMHQDPDSCVFPVPPNLVSIRLPMTETKTRNAPIALPHPCNLTHTLELESAALQPAHIPRGKLEINGLKWNCTYRSHKGFWVMTHSLITSADFLPSLQNADYVKTVHEIHRNSMWNLVIPRGRAHLRKRDDYGTLPAPIRKPGQPVKTQKEIPKLVVALPQSEPVPAKPAAQPQPAAIKSAPTPSATPISEPTPTPVTSMIQPDSGTATSPAANPALAVKPDSPAAPINPEPHSALPVINPASEKPEPKPAPSPAPVAPAAPVKPAVKIKAAPARPLSKPVPAPAKPVAKKVVAVAKAESKPAKSEPAPIMAPEPAPKPALTVKPVAAGSKSKTPAPAPIAKNVQPVSPAKSATPVKTEPAKLPLANPTLTTPSHPTPAAESKISPATASAKTKPATKPVVAKADTKPVPKTVPSKVKPVAKVAAEAAKPAKTAASVKTKTVPVPVAPPHAAAKPAVAAVSPAAKPATSKLASHVPAVPAPTTKLESATGKSHAAKKPEPALVTVPSGKPHSTAKTAAAIAPVPEHKSPSAKQPAELKASQTKASPAPAKAKTKPASASGKARPAAVTVKVETKPEPHAKKPATAAKRDTKIEAAKPAPTPILKAEAAPLPVAPAAPQPEIKAVAAALETKDDTAPQAKAVADVPPKEASVSEPEPKVSEPATVPKIATATAVETPPAPATTPAPVMPPVGTVQSVIVTRQPFFTPPPVETPAPAAPEPEKPAESVAATPTAPVAPPAPSSAPVPIVKIEPARPPVETKSPVVEGEAAEASKVAAAIAEPAKAPAEPVAKPAPVRRVTPPSPPPAPVVETAPVPVVGKASIWLPVVIFVVAAVVVFFCIRFIKDIEV